MSDPSVSGTADSDNLYPIPNESSTDADVRPVLFIDRGEGTRFYQIESVDFEGVVTVQVPRGEHGETVKWPWMPLAEALANRTARLYGYKEDELEQLGQNTSKESDRE